MNSATLSEQQNLKGKTTGDLCKDCCTWRIKSQSNCSHGTRGQIAYNLFSKFDVNLPVPDFSPAPPRFRHDPKHMDFRNLLKFTGKFNPNKDNQQKCLQF